VSELVLKNISKSYENGVKVVSDFNLEIKEKEFIIFVGPSGCGKSTTLRMIAGLEDITEGELWIDETFANYLKPKEREFSMVFQSYALYPNMNVYENIAFSLKVRKTDKKVLDQKVRNTAKLLGIEELLDRMPKDLSGGQRQRVAIGNAIIRDPKVLLMDEPLSNLDAKLRSQMRVELAKMHKEMGNTIVYVTHDQTEAMTLGTRIVVMKDGLIQQVDTPANLYQNPVNQFVAGFIGFPMMNFVEAKLLINNELIQLELFGEKIEIDGLKKEMILSSFRGEEKVIFGIRPENVKYNTPGYNNIQISGKVIAKELLGPEMILHVEVGETQITSIVNDDCRVKIGEEISMYFSTEQYCIFNKETEENLLYESRYETTCHKIKKRII